MFQQPRFFKCWANILKPLLTAKRGKQANYPTQYSEESPKMISSVPDSENQYVPGCGHLFSQKAWEGSQRWLSKLPETESLQAFLKFGLCAYANSYLPFPFATVLFCLQMFSKSFLTSRDDQLIFISREDFTVGWRPST